MSPEPRLYHEFATWFPLFAPSDYPEEGEFYARLIDHSSAGEARDVLELGSGAGLIASRLKQSLNVTLCDKSEDMLAVSRAYNPECEHILGDLRELRLHRLFDAVVIHDAIAYLSTEADFRAGVRTAYEHCRSGGFAVLASDWVRERFSPPAPEGTTTHGGHDEATRGFRYLEWDWDPDPTDTSYITDFAYLMRDENGNVRVEHDRHVFGHFFRERGLEILRESGFDRITRESNDKLDVEVFVAWKDEAT